MKNMLSKFLAIASLILSALCLSKPVLAQGSLASSPLSASRLSQEIKVPLLKSSHFTPFHAYFSTQDGKMIVYRVQGNGLQYLFENESFAERGSIFHSDYRFAYALNEQLQLTVIDPNSLLLVHNVIQLQNAPLIIKRVNNSLWVVDAVGVSTYPSNITQDSAQLQKKRLDWQGDLAKSAIIADDNEQHLWVLHGKSTLSKYLLPETVDGAEITLIKQWEITENTVNQILFSKQNYLLGFDSSTNELLKIEDGIAKSIAKLDAKISRIMPDEALANSVLVVMENNQLLRISTEDPLPPKLLLNAGAKIQLFPVLDHYWIRQGIRVYLFDAILAENSLIEPIERDQVQDDATQKLALDLPKFDEPLRFVHPIGEYFMTQLPLISGWGRADLFFELTAKPSNSARLQGQTFVWKPSMSEVGQHNFVAKVFSSQGIQDSLSITFEVRPFNEPPNFLPTRLGTFVVGEEVQISTKAIDPDGLDRMLLRYRAKDLPKGAVLDATKGEVVWTPAADQVGQHSFQVIASDQYGASSLQTVSVQVIDLTKEN
jgi:hypothetical protein